MDPSAKLKNRRPKAPELRARLSIGEAKREIVKSSGPNAASVLPSVVTFTVRRSVSFANTNNMFNRGGIIEDIASDYGVKVLPTRSISLINPREGRALAGNWQGGADSLRQMLEEKTSSFPVTLEGSIQNPIILGVGRSEVGPRYVGFLLDLALRCNIYSERANLREALGYTDFVERTISHISLYETRDQQVADQLHGELKGLLNPTNIQIELGQVV